MFDLLKRLFQREKNPPTFHKFVDPLGNFSIMVPEKWKTDEDIAIDDGKYTIPFDSPDELAEFSISIDYSARNASFDFDDFVKKYFNSPESGIHSTFSKTNFRKYPAYVREFIYSNRGRGFYGGSIIFYTGKLLVELIHHAPADKREYYDIIFEKMKESMQTGRD